MTLNLAITQLVRWSLLYYSITNKRKVGTKRVVNEEKMKCGGCGSWYRLDALRDHLWLSEKCIRTFQENLNVASREEVLKLFPCPFCHVDHNVQMKNHLGVSRQCYEGFKSLFMVDDSASILKKIGELRRKGYKSRKPEERANETFKRKNKELQYKTLPQLISEFRQKTTFSNYKMCFKCGGSYLEYSAEIINEENLDDLLDERIKRRKRMDYYWLCNWCSKDSEEVFKGNSIVGIDTLEDDVNRIYYPSVDVNYSNEEDFDNGKSVKCQSVFSPCSMEALKLYDSSFIFKPDPRVPYLVHMSGKDISTNGVAKLYNHQLSKYYNRVNFAGTFFGCISDFSNKVVSDIEPILDLFNIRGSNAWYDKCRSDMKFRMKQNGRSCLKISINVPINNPQTIATYFITKGFCVSATFEGDSKLEEKIKYFIHLSHEAHEPCSEVCETVDLFEYLRANGFNCDDEFSKYIPTYLASVHQIMRAFVQTFIKTPCSPIYSNAFYLTTMVNIEGIATVDVVLWPSWFTDLNLHWNDENVRLKFIENFDQRITTSVSPSSIRDQFRMSVRDSNQSAQFAKLYQTEAADDHRIKFTGNLPSMLTMFKFQPLAQENFTEALKLRSLMTDLYNGLSTDDLQKLKTVEWLEELSEWKVDFTSDSDEMICSFSIDEVDFKFVLDDKLIKFINQFPEHLFVGIYHYSLCCSDSTNENNLVVKRELLKSSFVKEYIPSIISALQSPIEVHYVKNFSEWVSLLTKRTSSDLSLQINQGSVSHHTEISLTELYLHADPKICVDIANTGISYVNTNMDRSPIFKMSKREGLKLYKHMESGKTYELLSSITDRHRTRINGEDVLIAEVGLFYKYVGSQQSEELYKAFASNIKGIPLSEVKGVWNNNYLPKYILASNGDVLELQRRRKVLKYPEYSGFNMMYTRIMLFFPLKPNMIIDIDEIGKQVSI